MLVGTIQFYSVPPIKELNSNSWKKQNCLLFQYYCNSCWTERKNISRTQDYKFTFKWLQLSFWLWFPFKEVYCDFVSWRINKNGKIRPGHDIGTQREWNFSWVYIHCISVYHIYGMIYSVACLHRYHSKLVSEWCESTLISSSSSKIEIWRHDMCKLWINSVLSFEQI